MGKDMRILYPASPWCAGQWYPFPLGISKLYYSSNKKLGAAASRNVKGHVQPLMQQWQMTQAGTSSDRRDVIAEVAE